MLSKLTLGALVFLSTAACAAKPLSSTLPNGNVVEAPIFTAASAPKRSAFAHESAADASLRRAATGVFALAGVPSGYVSVRSRYGHLTLTGQLRANDPKNQLLAVLTTLKGVKGIRDELTVLPEPLRAEAPIAVPTSSTPRSWWEVPGLLLALFALLALSVGLWRATHKEPAAPQRLPRQKDLDRKAS